MIKDYQISNDGTIFRIKEDGSISRIAKIDNDGNIENISNTSETHRTLNMGYWVIILLLVITAVILGILYSNSTNDLNNIRVESAGKNKELSETKALLNEISNEFPFVVTEIKVGNVYFDGNIETNYGDKIYSYNTMYLTPQLSIIGMVSEFKNIMVKWYYPNGTLSRGESSPSGYSQLEEVYISRGKNNIVLCGWGNETKGHWRKGQYRFEVWCDNKCIKTHYFKVY